MRRGGLRHQPVPLEHSCVVAKRIGNSSRREEVCDTSKSRCCRHSRDSQKESRQPRAHRSGRGEGEGLRSPKPAGRGSANPVSSHRTPSEFRTRVVRVSMTKLVVKLKMATASDTSEPRLGGLSASQLKKASAGSLLPQAAECNSKQVPGELRQNGSLHPRRGRWAVVAERLAFSLPTKASRIQSPFGSLPCFRMWVVLEVPLVCGFSRGSTVSPSLSFRLCSILSSIAFIGSQDLFVKSRPNIFSHFSLVVDGNISHVPTYSKIAKPIAELAEQIAVPVVVLCEVDVVVDVILEVAVEANGDVEHGVEQVLLVSSSRRPDHWIVPGGGVEPEEEPSTTAIREVMEEAGVCGKLGRCLGVFENTEHKHRTEVFVLVVTEELPEWEDSKTIGESVLCSVFIDGVYKNARSC
ncbi:hypothetical protein PR048_001077 [Dryococelus australis]|uniref:diphosphoinositol-polyphosphate diphosphatase n=1 Tax=Dryococelus australis TaxID=614101 RepID=A0ABQ9IGG6_9NEOP|nr:hypothetical protein PR048_001077 [Dryococelus australis]